jgi:phenylacetate-CoA ligase
MLLPIDPWFTGAVAADVWAASRADAEALAARQAQRLRALLTAATKGSRLFRESLGSAPAAADARLQDLPVSHKAELMRHFDDWVTDPTLKLDEVKRFMGDSTRVGESYLGRFTVWESSGSTGEPGVFVQDRHAMGVYDALESVRSPAPTLWHRLLDPWLMSERIVFVGAIGGHFASVVSMERLRRLSPMLAPRLQCVSFLRPLDELLAEVQALRPTVLASYPSAALLLAQAQEEGRLKVALREIWTGGETLTPAMRRGIQRGFGCGVRNSYGASEFLPMAGECSQGHLHLNSDWLILEPVDEHGRLVPPGHASATTLLTNLANHAQPLIRYDLGDQVKLAASPCACGSHLPVIDIQGRRDDTLRLAGRGRRRVPVLPLAVSTVLEEEAGLFDFQLRQQGPRELTLCTARGGAEVVRQLRVARKALEIFLAAQGVPEVHIHCHSHQAGQRGRSGKVLRVLATPPR